MPRRLWIGFLSVWPGLAQIWSGQEVLGLMLAALFAASINLSIAARWIWTGAFSPVWAGLFASVAILTWLCSAASTFFWIRLSHPYRHRGEIDRLFRGALDCYLQGRCNDPRKRIERVLALDETDADALMRLGLIYTRSFEPWLGRRAIGQRLELERGAN